jgi:hypothetical protein
MLADGIGPGRLELLDPTQDRPPADVEPAVGEHAGDAFGIGSRENELTQAVPLLRQLAWPAP